MQLCAEKLLGALRVHIFSGGVLSKVRPLLSVGAIAYGGTGRLIHRSLTFDSSVKTIDTHRTKMAGGRKLETNEDLMQRIVDLKADEHPKVIFITCAFPDYKARPVEYLAYDIEPDVPIHRITESGSHLPLLPTSWPIINEVKLLPMKEADYVYNNIRSGDFPRKDFFLVLFLATAGAAIKEMEERARKLMVTSSANIILVNDLHTKDNLIVPEKGFALSIVERRSAIISLVAMVKKKLTREKRGDNESS